MAHAVQDVDLEAKKIIKDIVNRLTGKNAPRRLSDLKHFLKAKASEIERLQDLIKG